MDQKVIELEFEEDATLEDIQAELLHFKNLGIIAKCIVKGKMISNEDVNKLLEEIKKIKYDMTESQYDEYLQVEEENRKIMKMEKNRAASPIIIRYWIERAKTVIDENKQDNFENYCYLLIESGAYGEIERQSPFLYKTVISAIKIMLKMHESNDIEELYKTIDREFSDVEYKKDLLDFKYFYMMMIICMFSNNSELYKKIVFNDEIEFGIRVEKVKKKLKKGKVKS